MAINELYTGWALQNLQEGTCLREKLRLLASGAKTLALRQAVADRIQRQEERQGYEERESVEIFLFYETTLRERLGLLSLIHQMAYLATGSREWISIDELEKDVQNHFMEHLLKLPLLESVLRQEDASRHALEALDREREASFTTLEDRKGSLEDNQYKEDLEEIGKRYRTALEALVRGLLA